MKENFLHFVSNTPATLEINGGFVGCIDNINCNEIDIISRTPHFFATYSPISDTISAIPYTFLLHTQSTPTTGNQYVKIVPFPNNNYDIIMNPFYYYQISEPEVLFNASIGKYFVSIIKDNIVKITIFSGGSIVFTSNAPQLSSVKVEEKKGLLIIEGLVSPNNYYLLVLDTSNFAILHNDVVQSIENTLENISSYKDIGSLCHHAQICTIDYASKKINRYYVYAENRSEYVSPYLIPLALLQCVKVGDENKCKSFLSKNLEGSTTHQLSQYFGEMKNIYFNRHHQGQKLNYTIEGEKMKNYNFVLDSGKVIDIEENF